jgi:hypothetical protein
MGNSPTTGSDYYFGENTLKLALFFQFRQTTATHQFSSMLTEFPFACRRITEKTPHLGKIAQICMTYEYSQISRHQTKRCSMWCINDTTRLIFRREKVTKNHFRNRRFALERLATGLSTSRQKNEMPWACKVLTYFSGEKSYRRVSGLVWEIQHEFTQ